VGGKTPLGILLRRIPSHKGRETSKPLPHPYTAAPWPVSALDLCFGVGQTREFFFNLSLKFAPTGSQTQDLSATGAT
jgi:hypothetical protein